MKISKKLTGAVAMAAGLVCLLVYLRALSCGFVNWDDQEYILNNGAIRELDWSMLSWAFTNHAVGWWMPLTWISFALDYHFWGLNPTGYHLTNIILHAANTGLVVLVADRLLRQGPGAGDREERPNSYYAVLLFAGLLWGIHPLRVESVAWATERKDVLNGLFSLGSMLCYLNYVFHREVSGEQRQARRNYVFSLVLMLFSLMAKQVSVVLPALMLVADWYPFGRLRAGTVRQVLVEKAPFLALSVAMSVFTLVLAAGESALAVGLSFSQKFVISGNAIFEYCRLWLWPVGIIPVYIIPSPIPSAYLVKTVAVVAIFCFCIVAGRKYKWLAATWLCFVIPLLPVLAFTQNGIQSFAARFTYLPSVGLSIMAAVAIAEAYARGTGKSSGSLRLLVVSATVVILVSSGVVTQRLIGVWHDSGTMWSRVIDFQPFDRAYFYRGLFFVDSGRYAEAVEDYTHCLQIARREGMPDLFNIYAFRGEAFVKAGRYGEALEDFSVAVEMSPHPLYFYHRGLALRGLGRVREAEEDFRRAGRASGQMRWFPS